MFKDILVPKAQIKVVKHGNIINLTQQCACQAGPCADLTPGGLLPPGWLAVWQTWATILPGAEPEKEAFYWAREIREHSSLQGTGS